MLFSCRGAPLIFLGFWGFYSLSVCVWMIGLSAFHSWCLLLVLQILCKMATCLVVCILLWSEEWTTVCCGLFKYADKMSAKPIWWNQAGCGFSFWAVGVAYTGVFKGGLSAISCTYLLNHFFSSKSLWNSDDLFQTTSQVIQVTECSILPLIYFILAYNKYFWAKDDVFYVFM